MNEEFFNKIILDDKFLFNLFEDKDNEKNYRIFYLINRIINNLKDDLIIVCPNTKELAYISTIYSSLDLFYKSYEKNIINHENWLKPGTYLELISSGEYDGTIFKYIGKKNDGIELETIPNKSDHLPGKIWQKIDNLLQFAPTNKRKNKKKIISKIGKAIRPKIDKLLGTNSFNNPLLFENKLIFLNDTMIDFQNKHSSAYIFNNNEKVYINDLISYSHINENGELDESIKIGDNILNNNLLVTSKISNIYNYFTNYKNNQTIICSDIKKISNEKNFIQYKQIKNMNRNSKFVIFASDTDYENIKELKGKIHIDIYKLFKEDLKNLYSEKKFWLNSMHEKIIRNKKNEHQKKIVTIKVKEPLFDDIDNSFNYISKVIKKESDDTKKDLKIILDSINNLRFKLKDHIFGFPETLSEEIREKTESIIIELKSRQTELNASIYDLIVKLINKFKKIPPDGKFIFDGRLKQFHEILKINETKNSIIYCYNKDRKEYYENNIKNSWDLNHKSILSLNSEVSFDTLIIPSEIITRDIMKLISNKNYKNLFFIGSENLARKMNLIEDNYEFKWREIIISENKKCEILKLENSYGKYLQNPQFFGKKYSENINILNSEDFFNEDEDDIDQTDDKNSEKIVPTIPIKLYGDRNIYLSENFDTIILNPIFDQYSYKQSYIKKKSENLEIDDIFMLRDSSDKDILETESSILYANQKNSYSDLKKIAFSTRDEISKSFGTNIDINKLKIFLKRTGWNGSSQTLRNLITGETKCPQKESDIDKILKACELNNPENYKYDKSITKKIFNYKKNYDRLRIAAGKNITPKIYKALKANPNISFDGLPLRVDYNIDGSISLGQKNTENPEAWIVQVKKVFMEKKVKKNYQIVNKLI